MQIVPGDGPRDQVREQHRDGKLPEQEDDHVAVAGTERLANADLLGAPVGGESSQAEEAQAGDKDGDGDENRENLALSFVTSVELFITVGKQGTRKSYAMNEGALGARDILHCLLRIFRGRRG